MEFICYNVTVEHFGIYISLSDVDLDGILTVDIPYTTIPLERYGHRTHSSFLAPDYWNIPGEWLRLTHQYPKYQTFEIVSMPNISKIEIVHMPSAVMQDINNPLQMPQDIQKQTMKWMIAYGKAFDTYDPKIAELELSPTPCKSDGLVPIIKYNERESACVKPATLEKLIERGWGRAVS